MDGKIKVNPSDFLAGSTGDFYDFFSLLNERHGEVFTLLVSRYTIHVLMSPAHIKHVLADNIENYAKETALFGILPTLVNEYSIITTNNQTVWKKDRETMNPFFYEQTIKNQTEIMAKVTEQHLADWKKFALNGKTINLNKSLTFLTLQSLISILFSDIDISFEQITETFNYVTYIAGKYRLGRGKLWGGFLPLPGYFKCKRGVTEALKLGEELVTKCLQAKSKNLVNTLLEAYEREGKTITREHLIQEGLTLLLAGHETTATVLTWTCIYMSLYPDIQQKMHEEVINAIGTRMPTADDLESLPYTRAVLFEAMRLQPPIQSLVRTAVEDDTIGSLKINKGDSIAIPIHHLHRLSRYWPNPEGFDPMRFIKPLPEEYKYIYLAFSAGPRSCVGRHFSIIESTIILAMIAQRYVLALKPGTQVRRESTLFNKADYNIEMNIILRN